MPFCPAFPAVFPAVCPAVFAGDFATTFTVLGVGTNGARVGAACG